MTIDIKYNPLTASTEIHSVNGMVEIADAKLRTSNKVRKALDDLIDEAAIGPGGSMTVEPSSRTHEMVRKIVKLLEGKKKPDAA